MSRGVVKLPTGIEGFDQIADGGLPQGRATLLSGSAGSAKTVFACQYLAAGILKFGQPGVFVTFEEPPDDVRRNMLTFGWDIARWEADGRWAFVDAAPGDGDEAEVVGDYDFGALVARIEHAVRTTGARRVAVDSLPAVFARFSAAAVVRRELIRVIAGLRQLGVTTLVTAERTEEYGPISRFGVEEFAADNVVVLRNVLDREKRRRTVEVLKFRGTNHQKGEFPFTMTADDGVVVLPLSALELQQRSSIVRIQSGNAALDAMCGGGFFRDSIILVSGPTGTGKTLVTTQFAAGGVSAGERCLLFAFEESRDQLFRNAAGWGVDFEGMEASGRLKIVCAYPETATLEDHLLRIKHETDAFHPNRVAVDSLTALERMSGEKSFREFVIGLTAHVKSLEIAGLFTATAADLLGGSSVTEAHISTITDSIILLRYVEMYGEMRRGITVLKMRGSGHDKDIRELTIDGQGMHVGRPFRNVAGIIAGRFTQLGPPTEAERVAGMFREEGSLRGDGSLPTP